MEIRLNGETHGVKEGSTVAALMEALKLDAQKIAVEVNLSIVPRSLYAETHLHPGDAVEIVRFIGGG
jgi:thiamine biosynthesis protein ThiS